MKKVLFVLMILATIFAMIACTSKEEHKHTVTGELIIVKEATCAEVGVAHTFCAECGQIVSAVAIPKTNDHTEVVISAIESTCTEKGLTEGKECSVCHEILVSQQETPLKAHTEEILPATNATCTSTGLTEGKHCSECGEILESQQKVAMLEHNYVTVVVIAPTCENQGYTTYTCECGYTDVGDYTNKKGHSFCDWITVKESTTTEEGKRERSCICGEKETQTIEKLKVSEGLRFWLDSNTQTYSVSIGTCTDTCIIIPSTYKGLPVTTIPDTAFQFCSSIISVFIPESITDIGLGPFQFCTSLVNIEVDKNNQYYKSVDGNLYTKNGGYLIQYAAGKKDTSFTVPDTVTAIGEAAFSGCAALIEVVIGDVRSIGNGVFADCTSLKSITFGKNLSSVGGSVFLDCMSLASVNFGGTIEQWISIYKYYFWYGCTGNYTIYCIDGEIAKDGSITYY